MTTPAPVHGDADEGFGPVVDVFRDNFTARGDVGAAVALYVRGRKVVDLYGGLADPRSGRRWAADTPAVVFSCTKGILAVCAYLLVQQGRLDLDAPVTRYWPEFGQHGKDGIPVRWLFTHQAGLPALDRPLTRADVVAWTPVIEAIEAQPPLWPPGTAHSYHAMTYGWLVGEVIRRVTGQLPGAFFRAALADPLGLRTWIGLPDAARAAVAWMLAPPPGAVPAPDPVAERGLTMNGAYPFPADDEGLVSFNDPVIQAAGIPGAGAVSTAEGLARLYAAAVSDVGGGPRLLTAASVDDATTPRVWGQQRYGPPDGGQRWGTGFLLDSPPARPLLGARSFGHDGAGGHVAFGDDAHEVGFAYVVNQMGGVDDERGDRLVAAVRRCLEG
ncbi:CubicO group peptidase, beta-lactamase class C family [Micromonospora haikouensis]|uniref:CubicO group peptidase, beta-lactamase class C family n=1 Tax=Micromonospora haikouensis TaxID=686309 RepID=A0A1C4YEQ3_9ACTN|nr:serine hydrolase domain-containing protein [Micromonospora haikouensis]SCF19213.1 CubicO group peptidase, beta-lactamase class C family [Micromonospora haikouensis]